MRRFLRTLSLGVVATCVAATSFAGGEDVTYLLTNSDFESGAVGWNIVGGNKIAATAANYGYNGTQFMEEWVAAPNTLTDRNWSQTIEVPNGLYVVRALAHAVLQSDASVVPSGIFIYANNDSVAVTTTNTNPPTEYSVETVVTDGKLRVGLCIMECNVNWVAWDNVRVTQYLGETEGEVKLVWVLDELDAVSMTAMELLEYKMQESLVTAIVENIDAIESVSTYEEGEALLNTLKALVIEAQESIDVYEKLMNEIENIYSNVLVDFGMAGYAELDSIVYAASYKYDIGSLDQAGVEEEIATLDDAVFAFNMANADGTTPFDVTEMFVTNPTVRTNAKGWDVEVITSVGVAMPAWGSEVMEFWYCDFNFSQTITGLPNGKYAVKVQGFYRADDGHNPGYGDVTAELFANNSSVPLTSIYQYTASEMGVYDNVMNDYVYSLSSAGLAFSMLNPTTGRNYYDDNELTVVVTDGTLTFGVRNTSTEYARWCAFRDFRLEYYGNSTNFAQDALADLIGEIEEYIDVNDYAIPGGMLDALDDMVGEASDYVDGNRSEEEVISVYNELDSLFAKTKESVKLLGELGVLVEEGYKLSDLGYSGIDALLVALEWPGEYVSAPYAYSELTYEVIEQVIVDVKGAMFAYQLSQEYSRETPADYTFFVGLPNFQSTQSYDIPLPWVTNNLFNNGFTDVWVGLGQLDAADYTNPPCLNSWSNDFVSMDVYQDIEGLPNGVYTVSAKAITQSLGKQHVYATSSMGTSVSPEMTIEGWDIYEWERLTTDYVVVTDGKLRIGFASESVSGDVSGWFQVTGFKLYYHGEATDEDLRGSAMFAQNVESSSSSIVIIPVELENSETITAFQFDMVLPEGVSPVYETVDGEMAYDITFNEERVRQGHVLSAAQLADGSLRVVAYSVSNEAFIGNSGVLVNVALQVGDIAEWDYPILMRNIRVVKEDATEKLCPDQMSTLTVKDGLLGDVNSDGQHTMSDVVMMVNAALEKEQANFDRSVADMNGDNIITMADVVLVLRLVLGYEPVAAVRCISREMPSVAMEAGSAVLGGNGELVLPIYMSSGAAYTAFQVDLVLPEDMTLVAATLGGRAKSSHNIVWNTLDNGVVRIVAFATDNATFKNTAESLLHLTLKSDAAVADDAVVALTNGLFATANGAEDRADDAAWRVGDETTNINGIATACRIYGVEGAVMVESATDAIVTVYTMTGQIAQQVQVKSGKNSIVLPAGVYVINGIKIIVK